MLLFVGLGNPGSKYENHRHSVGFMAVDTIVRRHNFLPAKKRWQGLSHEGKIGDEKIIVLKPQTYMNESGRSVSAAMQYFKLTPADVLVFYDELDLAFGKVKVKTGGGAAGHNGIRSLMQHIGADFTRVRIGIDHPGDKSRVHGHVLGDFSKAERPELEKILDAIASEAPFLAQHDYPRFLSQIALHLNPQRGSTGTGTGTGKTTSEQKTRRNQKNEFGAAQSGKTPAKGASMPLENKQPKEGPMAAMLKALKFGDK